MYLLVIASLAVSLIGVFAILYIFNRHVEVAKMGGSMKLGHNAVVEPLFLLVEHRLNAAGRYFTHRFYVLLLSLLSHLLPLFRSLTRSTEEWLVRMVNLVKGKRELNYLGRKAASPFIQDVANNQDEVRKEGGSIE